MILNILNQKVLDGVFPSISKEILTLLQKLPNEYTDYKVSMVNIVFVSPDYIKKLNTEFRNKETFTDVLSFNMDEEDLLGEVYVCPQYIKETSDTDPKEEIVRMIVHGILHLLGYDHTQEFNDQTKNTQDMFVKQEKIVQNILS